MDVGVVSGWVWLSRWVDAGVVSGCVWLSGWVDVGVVSGCVWLSRWVNVGVVSGCLTCTQSASSQWTGYIHYLDHMAHHLSRRHRVH